MYPATLLWKNQNLVERSALEEKRCPQIRRDSFFQFRQLDHVMVTVELTRNELGFIKANIAYALENCPVDQGDVIDVDGHLSSRPYYVQLLEKPKAIEVKPTNKIELNEQELRFMVASSGYATKHCPVDGGLTTDDGEFSTRRAFGELHEKLPFMKS